MTKEQSKCGDRLASAFLSAVAGFSVLVLTVCIVDEISKARARCQSGGWRCSMLQPGPFACWLLHDVWEEKK